MGRVRDFLNRDADDFFDQLAMAELGFFRRHPWRTHALGITVWGASFGAIWIMGGLRTAVIVASVSLAVAAVMFVIASGRR